MSQLNVNLVWKYGFVTAIVKKLQIETLKIRKVVKERVSDVARNVIKILLQIYS